MTSNGYFEVKDNKYLEKYLDKLYEKAKTTSTLTFNKKFHRQFMKKEQLGNRSKNVFVESRSVTEKGKDFLHHQNNIENINQQNKSIEQQYLKRNLDVHVHINDLNDFKNHQNLSNNLDIHVHVNNEVLTNLPSQNGDQKINSSFERTGSSQNLSKLQTLHVNFKRNASKECTAHLSTNCYEKAVFVNESKLFNTCNRDINLHYKNQNCSNRNINVQQTSTSVKRLSSERNFNYANVPKNKRFRKYYHSSDWNSSNSPDIIPGVIQSDSLVPAKNISDLKQVGNIPKEQENKLEIMYEKGDRNIPNVKSSFKHDLNTDCNDAWCNVKNSKCKGVFQRSVGQNTERCGHILVKNTNSEVTQYSFCKERISFTKDTNKSRALFNRSADQLQCTNKSYQNNEYMSQKSIEQTFESLCRRETGPKLKFRRTVKSRSLPSFLPANDMQNIERPKEQENCDYVTCSTFLPGTVTQNLEILREKGDTNLNILSDFPPVTVTAEGKDISNHNALSSAFPVTVSRSTEKTQQQDEIKDEVVSATFSQSKESLEKLEGGKYDFPSVCLPATVSYNTERSEDQDDIDHKILSATFTQSTEDGSCEILLPSLPASVRLPVQHSTNEIEQESVDSGKNVSVSLPANYSQSTERLKEQENNKCNNEDNFPGITDDESDTDSNKSGFLPEKPNIKESITVDKDENKDQKEGHQSQISCNEDNKPQRNVNSKSEEKMKESFCEQIKQCHLEKNRYDEKYGTKKHYKKDEKLKESKNYRIDSNHSKWKSKQMKNKISGRSKENKISKEIYKDRKTSECSRCDKKTRRKCRKEKPCASNENKKLKLDENNFSNLYNNDITYDKKASKRTFFQHFRSERHMKTRGVLKIIEEKQRLTKELTFIDQKIQDIILKKHEKQVKAKDTVYDCLDDLDEKDSMIDDINAALPSSHVTEWSNGERQYTITRNTKPQVLHNGGIWKSITREKV